MQAQPTAATAPSDRRALSNLKHGLTGRIYLFDEAEQSAYDNLCRGLQEALAPAGAMEAELVRTIADDQWRLRRAAALEASIFADGQTRHPADPSTGDPGIDAALSQGRTWLAEARNLNLLTLYESRIHRRLDKNLSTLRGLQAERKAALEQAVQEAAILSQLSKSKGEFYDPAEPFRARNFEFSLEEIARKIDRWGRLKEAQVLSKTTFRRAA